MQHQLLTIILFLSASGIANAAALLQARFVPIRTTAIPHAVTIVLRSEMVHRELRLQANQIRDIDKAVSEVELSLWRLRDRPFESRVKVVPLLIGQLKSKLAWILSKQQLKRLNQIVRQAQGINCILEPEVVIGLRLSVRQVNNIRAVFNILNNKLTAVYKNTGTIPKSLSETYLLNLYTQAKRNVLFFLGPSQRYAYTNILGPKFDLSQLRRVGCKAPELNSQTWLNSPPLKPTELKGKVTVVHFYTFGCINCNRNLPYYNDWVKSFGSGNFRIIGIHTPETKQEQILEEVKAKAVEAGMNYPIVIDNKMANWASWANQIWPSIYLIDKNGFIRYWWYGELNWHGAQSEKWMRARIRELMEEPQIDEQTRQSNM